MIDYYYVIREDYGWDGESLFLVKSNDPLLLVEKVLCAKSAATIVAVFDRKPIAHACMVDEWLRDDIEWISLEAYCGTYAALQLADKLPLQFLQRVHALPAYQGQAEFDLGEIIKRRGGPATDAPLR